MQANSYDDGGGGGADLVVVLLGFILVGGLMLMAFGGIMSFLSPTPSTSSYPSQEVVVEEVEEVIDEIDYGSLPFTQHALAGRPGEEWDAMKIQAHFSSGKCTPKISACGDEEYHFCDNGDGKSLGLIIGRYVKQIMTGYMAKTSYWEGKCQ